MPREDKQPMSGKIMFSIEDLARIIELPEGLDPKRMYVTDDPQYLCLVVEGEPLKGHPANRYAGGEAPIISRPGQWVPLDMSDEACAERIVQGFQELSQAGPA